NGERLESGGRQPRRLTLEHEALDIGRQVGVALEAVAAGDADEHEAPVVALIGGRQLGAEGLHLLGAHLQELTEELGLDRFLGHHEDRFDRSRLFRGHQPSYMSAVERSVGSASAGPTHAICSSPKLPAWAMSTKPRL